ncbi:MULTISPECIES: YggS family pyridoxal phosphate-dependent enzyme [unclassified Streptococcus]|uniref:YggS family pyridoxal phosphate-dependent enzyme n=1 Tax=unclassified Streptococcus TaxID=2608887 RepID=UPI0010725DF6|nr:MULTISPECIES: YggS family pyridoxal phosphate-dependent enzyme [unclassified Streptococcus]MBF0805974.1 YggS family pyridoxal phosphate-dependent enzyme [Streptococcus sp. 19428wA2_WM07]TFU28442.1 YggS family pyridoxal phosphate-dependent enzyme [Streptococcus sp. WM07]
MNFQKQAQLVKEEVTEAVRKSVNPARECQIIAVTKYVDADVTRQLVEETGFHHLGENRVPQFLAKKDKLSDLPITWHFIGSLQRRKVKDVINHVDYFHALDSVSLAREIQKRAEKPIACFLQVNLSREESKHGFFIENIDSALEEIAAFDKIRLVGLMTMAPAEAEPSEIDKLFNQTRILQQELAERKIPGMPFTELSMGMSSDYQLAAIQGATFVRIGSLLFE